MAELFPNASVEIYVSEIEVLGDYKIISNGDGYIIYCVIEEMGHIIDTYSVMGYTLKIPNFNMEDVLHKINPSYSIMSMEYIYGYKGGIFEPIRINDLIINFQCAEVNGTVNLGFPVLLGSY